MLGDRLVNHAVVPRIANTGIDAGYNLNIMYTDGSRETIPLRWGVRAVLFRDMHTN